MTQNDTGSDLLLNVCQLQLKRTKPKESVSCVLHGLEDYLPQSRAGKQI